MYETALRCGAENPWFQFVPILNNYSLVVEIAKLEWRYIILVFTPLVNIVAGMYILYRVVENAGFPRWTIFLLLVPVLGFFVPFYWAFGPQPAARY